MNARTSDTGFDKPHDEPTDPERLLYESPDVSDRKREIDDTRRDDKLHASDPLEAQTNCLQCFVQIVERPVVSVCRIEIPPKRNLNSPN